MVTSNTANTRLKVYREDPIEDGNYTATSNTLDAPRLCEIFAYGLTLLFNDPVVQTSFADLVENEREWDQVRSHPPALVALVPSQPAALGRQMAACHRGIGPTEAMIFFDQDLATTLEAATDFYTEHLLSFVCIVTVLHELRHWVRGVIKGMDKVSDSRDRHLNWGLEKGEDKPRGETGYLGEHRLWGGVFVAGFGVDDRKPRIRFSTQAQKDCGWPDIKAAAMTQGLEGRLRQLHVYKWSYVRAVVGHMKQLEPFEAPIPNHSYVRLDRGLYTPEDLRQIMEVDATTSETLNLDKSPPYARGLFTSVATEERYYPVLKGEAPGSPGTRSRTVSYEVIHPKRTRLRRLVAWLLRKDKHKLTFVPLVCSEVSETIHSAPREHRES